MIRGDFRIDREQAARLRELEPSAGKGATARATLYFLIRYRGRSTGPNENASRTTWDTLLDWHNAAPVPHYERHWNMLIFAIQGNGNPLIDFPSGRRRLTSAWG